MATAAVIGIGDISAQHLAAIDAHPDIELVAVCDIDPARAAAAADRWGVEAFTDHTALLARVRPDVVHLTVPHHVHVPVALAALATGSHVLTEKPLGHTVASARILADAARSSDRKVGVCYQNRYNPTSVALKDAVDSGRYGRVLGARASVWWHRTPAYYEASPWRGLWAQGGGGALINQSIHTIDLLCWVLGRPEVIRGQAGTLVLNDEIEVEDAATVILTHPAGVGSVLFATNDHFTNAPISVEIALEGGVLRLEEGVLVHTTAEGSPTVLATDVALGGQRSYWGSSHAALINDFYARLDEPGPFWIDPDAALVSLTVVRTVYARSGLIAADAL